MLNSSSVRLPPRIGLPRLQRLAFYLLVLALPLEGFVAFYVRGFPVSLTLLAAVTAASTLALRPLFSLRVTIDGVNALALLLPLPAIFSSIGALSQGILEPDFLGSLAYSMFFPLLFVLAGQVGLGQRDLRRFLVFQLTVFAAVAVVGIYQAIANNTGIMPPLQFSLTNPITGEQRPVTWGVAGVYERPTSFFAEPSWFAHFSAYGVFLGVGALGVVRSRAAVLIVTGLIFLGLLLSGALGGYLVFAGALLVYLMAEHRLRRTMLLSFVAIVGGAALLLSLLLREMTAVLLQDLSHRVETVRALLAGLPQFGLLPPVGTESVLDRLSLGLFAFPVWLHSPLTLLFGWGVGAFPLATERVLGVAYPFSGFGWTNVLAEQGALGLLAYVAFFLVLAAKCFRLRVSQPGMSVYTVTSLRLIVVLFVLSGFTGGFGFERSVVLWSLLSSLNIITRSLPSTPTL